MAMVRKGGCGFLTGLWRAIGRLASRRTPGAGRTSAGAAPLRGTPRLRQRSDGRPRCVACALCAAACPSDCIRIEASAPPWVEEACRPATSERWPAVFELDLGRCLLCGLCESACPEEAISLDPQDPMPVAAERASLLLGRDALLRR